MRTGLFNILSLVLVVGLLANGFQHSLLKIAQSVFSIEMSYSDTNQDNDSEAEKEEKKEEEKQESEFVFMHAHILVPQSQSFQEPFNRSVGYSSIIYDIASPPPEQII